MDVKFVPVIVNVWAVEGAPRDALKLPPGDRVPTVITGAGSLTVPVNEIVLGEFVAPVLVTLVEPL